MYYYYYYMLLGKSKNEDGTQKKTEKCQVRIEKKHFQDDIFGMRQLNCLKVSHIILKHVNILSANFDFEKVKQNKVREVLAPRISARSPKWTFWQIFGFEMSSSASFSVGKLFLLSSSPHYLSLHPHAAIYPTTTLTSIGQTLPQPPQVIQQQQQREGEGERTLLLFFLHFHTSHLLPRVR